MPCRQKHTRASTVREPRCAREGISRSSQQVVPTSSLELPTPDGGSDRFYFVLGMFGYGENYSGLLIRGALGSPVVNVSRGGGVSWAFVE